MVQPQQPPGDEAPKLNVTISLSEIHNALCPACREALVKLLSDKASGVMLEEALRRQLEPPAPPAPPAPGPNEHS